MLQQLILLGVLLEGKTHGYRLNEYVLHAMGQYTDIKKSKVYYTLGKMEKDGYVEQETEREGNRPERRVYQITEQGKTYFLQLLRNNLGGFARTYFNDDIGIAFMDKLPQSEVRELLKKKREMTHSTLQQLREVPDHGGNWGYVITHDVAHLETDLAWIDEILNDMENTKL